MTHEKIEKKQAIEKILEVFKLVRMQDPVALLDKYPHQLSGGMRQRVMIAMALLCNPKLLIADEATTALDVTIQAQILGLIKRMNEQLKLSVLIITHNFGIVAQICDKVAVMYAGYVVEIADIKEIFARPRHPYTRGLLSAIPPIDRKVERLRIIEGSVPNLIEPPSGCRFHPRCERFVPGVCDAEAPKLVGDEHMVACFNPYNGGGSK
jgi:oligopeptide/dipeptide ABC transporter ATP-binding protein